MKQTFLLPLVCLTIVSLQPRAMAHGSKISYKMTQAVTIDAVYDTGEAIAKAQVVVFSPQEPSKPWLTGTTDEKGRFLFVPDTSLPGVWKVQVRQAGHGGVVEVPVQAHQTTAGDSGNQAEENKAVTNTDSQATVSSQQTNDFDYTPLQRGLMIGSVIWGFVGTALFFTRRGQNAHS